MSLGDITTSKSSNICSIFLYRNIYQQLSRLSRALQPLPRNTTSSHVVINFDSLQNKYLNQDCNTSPEYIIVNQNSHFPGRQITLSQSSSTTPQSPEVNNLVVNKLYDISSKTDCNSTCKCDVEIQAGTDGCGVSIKIKDCYCTYNNNNNGNAPNKNQTTMVENPDYLETPNLAFRKLFSYGCGHWLWPHPVLSPLNQHRKHMMGNLCFDMGMISCTRILDYKFDETWLGRTSRSYFFKFVLYSNTNFTITLRLRFKFE